MPLITPASNLPALNSVSMSRQNFSRFACPPGVDAAVGDDLDDAVGEQQIDQHAVVVLGVPYPQTARRCRARGRGPTGCDTAARRRARPRPQSAPVRNASPRPPWSPPRYSRAPWRENDARRSMMLQKGSPIRPIPSPTSSQMHRHRRNCRQSRCCSNSSRNRCCSSRSTASPAAGPAARPAAVVVPPASVRARRDRRPARRRETVREKVSAEIMAPASPPTASDPIDTGPPRRRCRRWRAIRQAGRACGGGHTGAEDGNERERVQRIEEDQPPGMGLVRSLGLGTGSGSPSMTPIMRVMPAATPPEKSPVLNRGAMVSSMMRRAVTSVSAPSRP